MLEEHFYWVLVIDRYVSQEARYLQGLARGPDGRAMMPKGLLGEHTRRGMVAMMTRKAHEQGGVERYYSLYYNIIIIVS